MNHDQLPQLGDDGRILEGVVTTLNDELDTIFDAADLSLREALEYANLGLADTITFDTNLFTPAGQESIVLTMGELTIRDDVIINGPGSDELAVVADTASRIFNIDNGPARTSTLELDRTTGDGFRSEYQGIELSANARLPNGGTIFGGWTM